ncbi:hypothetical protein GCM10009702_09690 [Propioniferax innocua]
MFPVLDRDTEGPTPRVELGDDRLDTPVAELINHVAPIPLRQKLRVQTRILWPRLGMRTNTDLWFWDFGLWDFGLWGFGFLRSGHWGSGY